MGSDRIDHRGLLAILTLGLCALGRFRSLGGCALAFLCSAVGAHK
jgi:hypothetical protein